MQGDGVVEWMDAALLRQYHGELVENRSRVDELPTLWCAPISALLRQHCVSHVDWWVLDVEGAELDVLRGVDWARVSVDVIVVEEDGRQPDKDAAVRSLLAAAGFIFDGKVRHNAWFRHASFHPHRGHSEAPTNVYSTGVEGYFSGGDLLKRVAPLPPGWAVFAVDRAIVYHTPEPWKLRRVAPTMEPMAKGPAA